MSREPIPEDLRRFLLTSVPSVPFVEALLLLREGRGEPLETAHIARRLYMPERGASAVLEQLAAAAIVERVVLFLEPKEDAPGYYIVRLIAYGLIIAAIVHKNRGAR